ncbi:MAG TPA: hypothetical protein VFH90_10460, partial [Candidatus Limnocylindria bacterium]|nr:hypothetical protein [Candidatus Limnocylindria bacterium]
QVFQEGPPLHLYVYDDGFVIRGTPGQLADDPQWQQRQMAAEGVQALIGSVVASGLRNCIDVPVSGSQLEVKARTADGVVAISLGSGSFRVASPEELDAAAELAQVLRDEDLGIVSEGWADLAWRPYPLERWEVRISRWEGREDAFSGAVSAPWPDMVLPDGTSPLTFGRSIPVNPGGIFDEERCGVLTREEADAFGAFLDTQQTEGTWAFQDASGGVSFNVNPLLPHRSGCASSAGASPETPRGNLIEDLDACAYLPEQLLADVLPEPWTPFDSQRETHGDGGWASCEYWEAWVYASRHRIGADEARAAVEVQFGFGLVSDSIDGRTVYFNDCLSAGATCSPAIAIAAPPHLVIIVPTDADESMLRALAAALIQRLDQT